VTPVKLVRLLGLDLADLGVEAVATLLADRPPGAPFGYVVTPNADHFVRLWRDPLVAEWYAGATMCLLDSRVIARVATALGLAVPVVTPGSDLVDEILRRRLRPGDRLTVIGLRADLLPRLRATLPGVTVNHLDPVMGFERDPAAFEAVVRFVCANPSRFVLLAVGSPRQEHLAAAIAATGQACGVGLCIGASVNLFLGTERRAPTWMRLAGLEWLHRLARDPRRLARRYLLDDPPIVFLLMHERFRRGLGAPVPAFGRSAPLFPIEPGHIPKD
jgi:exopolysaccharide biosynthesis WecB/TagA/CpsF family protein